jgi:hypothetical protein
MPAAGRPLIPIVLASLSLFAAAGTAGAQQQPVATPAPDKPEFLSRFDFHMTIDRLMRSQTAQEQLVDRRFSWDMHYGGEFDLVDYVRGRATITADYQAVLGNEFRPFDPNQANYALEAALSARASDRTEIAGFFHHVSRHISDRPKPFAVAFNLLGARFLHHGERGKTTFDVTLDGSGVVARSFVDYLGITGGQFQVRHPFNAHTGMFLHAEGQLILVDKDQLGRSQQAGARVEAGIRLNGRGGVMELFAGYETRPDAHPLERISQRWGLVGLRLLSR